MKSTHILGTSLALALAQIPAAQAVELTLWHSWSNDSEMSALNTIVDEFVAGGNTVVAASTPHETAGESPLTSLFVAGTPPNLFIAAQTDFYQDLKSQGLSQDMTALFDEIGATAAFPDVVKKAITIDGEMLKIPVAVHIDGIIYYNIRVAEELGIDPTAWQSLDDMWADQEKAEAAGKTFIAIGGNTFQAGYTFHPILAAVGGADTYTRFYAGTPDETVFEEQGLRDAIETFRKIADQMDEGWVNRAWNDTTNMVINGDALMQIHGDWMKGVWRVNNKEIGTDFGCVNIPGAKAVSVTVDAFGILGGVDEETLKAEMDFASIVVDPEINAEFAYLKGSTPVRLDVPTERLDACNELAMENLSKPELTVENPFYIGDTDWINSVWNTMYTFQGDPSMTTDDAIQMLKDEYAAIFCSPSPPPGEPSGGGLR
jgi:glucose/mannose transport system substrate-binding protein